MMETIGCRQCGTVESEDGRNGRAKLPQVAGIFLEEVAVDEDYRLVREEERGGGNLIGVEDNIRHFE